MAYNVIVSQGTYTSRVNSISPMPLCLSVRTCARSCCHDRAPPDRVRAGIQCVMPVFNCFAALATLAQLLVKTREKVESLVEASKLKAVLMNKRRDAGFSLNRASKPMACGPSMAGGCTGLRENRSPRSIANSGREADRLAERMSLVH